MYLVNTTDKIQAITSSAAAIDSVIDYVDAATSTLGVSGSGRQLTALSSAATTDILGAPAGSTTRTVKKATWRNKDASLAGDLTIQYNANGTLYEMKKVTLQPGWDLSFIEGLGFFVATPVLSKSGLKNSSTGDQALTAAAAQYLTGSAILLPSPVPVGLILRWRVQAGKTGAGTSTSKIGISFGTAGTTGDTIRNDSGALDTETAIADEWIDDVQATIRGPISSSCIVQSHMMRNDNLTTTGISNTARKAQVKQIQSAAFDITVAGTIAGLQYTMGTADVTTVRSVTAEMLYQNG